MGWLLHVLGVDNLSGRWYGWWSGAGSDLAYLGIIGALARRGNCEVKGCWRLGRHKTAAGHKVCRRHHPDDHLTAQQVTAEHENARRQ
jgi:hypothetical protein